MHFTSVRDRHRHANEGRSAQRHASAESSHPGALRHYQFADALLCAEARGVFRLSVYANGASIAPGLAGAHYGNAIQFDHEKRLLAEHPFRLRPAPSMVTEDLE